MAEEIDKLGFTYYLENPMDEEGFHWWLNNRWDWFGDEDPIKLYGEYLDKLKNPIKKKIKGDKFVWITIQDFQRRIEDVDKLETFINRIAYMYNAGFWIIEAGKSDPPNLHIHMFVKIKNSKKHKASLNAKWMSLFNTDLSKKDYYLMKQWRSSPDMPSYEDWCQEKLDYFDNEKKGSHENVIDLNLSGEF